MANPLVISSSTLALRVLNICLLHKSLPKLFNVIEQAKQSVDFGNINCKDYSYAKFLIFLIIMLSVPYQLYTAYMQYNFNEKHNVLKYIILTFNHYNNFSAVCLETQFSYLCYILKNRLEIVNEHLRRNYGIGSVHLNIKKSIASWNYHQQAHLKSIVDLRECHHKLCDSCSLLNKLYSIQLLVSLTACLINTLLNFYFAIYGGFVNTNPTTVHNIITQTIWGLYYVVRFVDICASADRLAKEATLTNILLCDQLAQCNDRSLKDVLWTFHAYTVSNEVKFTAMGFFKIDLTLISSAVSAGTTYLVILAQFHGQKQKITQT
ncbi:putative gustatory receptor 28b [Anthonomus grandis grandis]|uniref:putative gustatory receptor 28b n=1 Tax=Anthonomus grandis grandis TaxID=2921223 RepID=UPI002165B73E|nr:putative gustatory receptor 28b [Anthonomus grandis grandis]